MTPGGGQVLDSSSSKPVEGATVLLKCLKSRPGWTYGEGSWYTAKEVEVTSDANGSFSFSGSEIFECHFVQVIPRKDGYVHTAGLDSRHAFTNWNKIPERLWLTPTSDANLQRLKYHAAMSQGVSSSPTHQYTVIYSEFIPATRLAKTKDEIEFVRRSFCDRLAEANEKLSDGDRQELEKISVGTPASLEPTVPIVHYKYVVPYCAGP